MGDVPDGGAGALDPLKAGPAILAAEALILDLIVPLLVDSSDIPTTLDLLYQAGWTGLNQEPSLLAPEVQRIGTRTLDRYISSLQEHTDRALMVHLPDRVIRLLSDAPGEGMSQTRLARLLREEFPWVTRDYLRTRILPVLEADGFIDRGYCRLMPRAAERPTSTPAARVADAYLNLTPALLAYLDHQPGALAGMGGIVTTAEGMERLGEQLREDLEAGLAPFRVTGQTGDDLVRMRIHLMVGPAAPVGGAEPDELEALPEWLDERQALLRSCVLPTAAAVYRLVRDPDRAHNAVKWGLVKALHSRFPGPRGGFNVQKIAQRGLYWKLCARLEQKGVILLSRKTRRIVETPEAEWGLLERLTLYALHRAYPETVGETKLWELVQRRAEDFDFSDYQQLLLGLAQQGFAVLSRSSAGRVYRAPRAHIEDAAQRIWMRWERLWTWLSEFRSISGACLQREAGARSLQLEIITRRQDLSVVQEQIQAIVPGRMRSWSDLEYGSHPDGPVRDHRVLIFTHQDPRVLDNAWESE